MKYVIWERKENASNGGRKEEGMHRRMASGGSHMGNNDFLKLEIDESSSEKNERNSLAGIEIDVLSKIL